MGSQVSEVKALWSVRLCVAKDHNRFSMFGSNIMNFQIRLVWSFAYQRMVILKKKWMWKMLLAIRNYGTASGSDFLFVDKPPSAMYGCCEGSLSSLELNEPDLSYRQHRSHNGRESGKSSLGIRSVKHYLSCVSAWHAPQRQCRKIYNLQCVERRVWQL